MIISYRHRFIFVHSRKTGGNSIKLYLQPNLGPFDISVGGHVERIAAGVRPNLRFWMSLLHPKARKKYLRLRQKGYPNAHCLNEASKEKLKGMLGKETAHPNAAQLASLFPKEWNSFFKFCFVRNPYERAVSDYLYKNRNKENPGSFTEHLQDVHTSFMNGDMERRHFDNWPLYTIKDRIAVDMICKYENFEQDFKTACKKIGIEPPETVPRVNTSQSNYDYRSFYSNKEKAIVEQIFNNEIEFFGYSF